MSNSPKASRPRYQKIRELGHNREGGRVTYLAKDNATGQAVVIKQFQFAQSSSDWTGLKAYDREIQFLRSLNHPGIPRYLNSFETPKGFCMVQEYKEAESLAVPRQWTPEDIKQIAISVLDILIYLQNRIPPVIHRDIKPENILVDDQMNVYLVDFGFARISGGEVAMSSVAAGTFGFMAPEQIYNRELNNATDLYGLGATLICLLTGTKSTAVETLMDDTGRFNFKPKVSTLNRGFINWLEKIVQPKSKDRYASAAMAKEALTPLSLTPVPDVHLSHSILQFKATKLGEKLTQTITVSNPIPKTVLKGRWEVAPHPNDPPHTPDSHAWISFAPASFQGNQVECSITVDTKKLLADKVYNRQILLQTNSEPLTYNLAVEVNSGTFNIKPYDSIASLIFSCFLGFILYLNMFSLFLISVDLIQREFSISKSIIFTLFPAISTILWSKTGYRIGLYKGATSIGIGVAISLLLHPGVFFLLISLENLEFFSQEDGFSQIICLIYIIFSTGCCLGLGNLFGFLVQNHIQIGFSKKFALKIAILQNLLGPTAMGFISLSILLRKSMFMIAFISVVGLSILSIGLVIRECKKLVDEYRKSEPHRIKP
jgi:serine/threonine protein kinase